ncbi:hypothetical protein M404DRAFT_322819 [Pisolithus tinctorius Marx 270]|uniref:Uncharacterized protein n=1 Tax=Pisolithus tinctorius Marx 270 TaxID=870435 RepID=A0A0C3KGG6_PISTI|nr:hypothetical protein M404DRAFT_322819 [Pisolithus tinctorius Marx 270]
MYQYLQRSTELLEGLDILNPHSIRGSSHLSGWEGLNVPTIRKASSSFSSDHASRRLVLAMLPPGIPVNFLFRMRRYPGSFLIAMTFMSPNGTVAKRFYVCASYELDQYSSSVYIQKTVVTVREEIRKRKVTKRMSDNIESKRRSAANKWQN